MREVTNLLQRLEAFEDRAGITLEGLFARIEYGWSPGPMLRINGEAHASNGGQLETNVEIKADVIDADGRVVATGGEWLWRKDFYAFESFSIEMILEGTPEAARIRIYPSVRT